MIMGRKYRKEGKFPVWENVICVEISLNPKKSEEPHENNSCNNIWIFIEKFEENP